MIESAAKANDIPAWFLTRVIWKESRFRPHAVGPVTRSGARALGIAQFMPSTAAERQLSDPFDPVQALPQAAAFLSELRDEFGSLGLAAAAYNAGPQRVRDWLSGSRTMPAETENYVLATTGASIEAWRDAKTGDSVTTEKTGCGEMIADLKNEPSGFFGRLKQRITAGTSMPWAVVLAAGFSKDVALGSYSRSLERYSRDIGDHDPIISSRTLRSRGTSKFYQVAMGAESRSEANRLCSKIRRNGGACMVARQSHGSSGASTKTSAN